MELGSPLIRFRGLCCFKEVKPKSTNQNLSVFVFFFSEKIRFDISCELSAKKWNQF